jgi:hypothetical protein
MNKMLIKLIPKSFRPSRIRSFTDELRLISGQAAIQSNRCNQSKFKFLWDAEVKIFSQWGEDGILDYLCELLEIVRPRIIEFGSGNFTECNSRYLAEARNASVLAVDARTDLDSSIKSLDIAWRSTVVARQEWITPDTAPNAMAAARSEFEGLDIVSLDIDGNDYWVAESLNLTGVRVVVVEYNSRWGAVRAVTVPREDNFDRSARHFSNVYYGASLKAFIRLFESKNLIFLGTNRACNNAFFVSAPLPSAGIQPPDTTRDLDQFTDLRFREARDESGNLTYSHPGEALKQFADLPLWDLDAEDLIKVSELASEADSS